MSGNQRTTSLADAAVDAPVDGPGADVLPVIAERFSPAVFDPSFEITDAQAQVLLDAARWAPSAGNSQPYRYLMGLRGDDAFEAIVSTLTRGNRRWAPAASLLAVSIVQVAALPGSDKQFWFAKTAAHDAGQATAYLTLQAHSMGLAVHQFAGFDHEALAERIGLPEHWQVMAGIAVGRAWPQDERDPGHPAVAALGQRVEEYDLVGNIERETKPRSRRAISEVLWTPEPAGEN